MKKIQKSKFPEQSASVRIFGVNRIQKCRSKNYSFKFLVVALIFALCALSLSKSEGFAQEMQSQNFRVQGGNFNMTSGNKTSQNFKLSDVVGQTGAGIFASKGYIIHAGFLNEAEGGLLSFSVDPNVIDFGNLTPNNPLEKTLRITISNGNATGYTVRVSENQPLATAVGAEIPDTVCDGVKNTPCSISQSRGWLDPSTYGFGYKVEGRTSPSDFNRKNYFRPFAATRKNDKPVVVMESRAKKAVDQSTMTLRVNIGANQPVGQYRNVLSFSAIAGI